MHTTSSPRAPKTGFFGPLRHRAFRRFWVGGFLSNIGSWMELIAVGIYITTTTHSAMWAGLAVAASALPGTVLGPIGGALADRYSRKALVMVSVALQGACSATMMALALTHTAQPALIVMLVGISGAAFALGLPSLQAILPSLVPDHEMPRAVGLTSASYHLGRIFGLVGAGVVMSLVGIHAAFALNAVSNLAIVIALVSVAVPRVAATTTPLLRSIRRGAAFVRCEPGLRQGFVLMTFCSLFAAPAISLVPAVALKVFHNAGTGTTVLTLGQGIGAVSGALFLGAIMKRFGNRRVMQVAIATLPAAVLAYALSPTLAVAGVAVCIIGVAYITAFAGFTAVIQARTPQALRGRVLSLFVVLQAIFGPLGCIVQGRVGDSIGLRATMLIAATCMLVAGSVASMAHRGFVPGLAIAPSESVPAGEPSTSPRLVHHVATERRTRGPVRTQVTPRRTTERRRLRTAPRSRHI